ncbi:ATP-binding cassette domain-containing protein [Oerskovia sp. KBS0722]|uniref:ATP-binding cassette domain-containing protein n=1 Tax=Oerskovia sp. KBS0722 TaxID=1179673 RepID=UPI00110D41F0|nr:ATP-binding cassette domain-containing protein [Oerskovia sp. KBS0722]QDW62739.1 ATP-binding cassette domain-containing protein [Oerskovia sp. KBS0722]
MPDPMIDVRGLTKAYGSHAVLQGVDLTVRRGEIYALLGPNGAGKTTAVNILTTLVRPDAGTASIAGHDVVRQAARVREVIALTGQYASVDGFQTGEENLAMMATLAHLPRAVVAARTAELLDRFDLTDAAGRRVETYSGGMRRRLDLAISLVADPRVLILDEPTTGLDPQSRTELWDVVRELAADGITVLLTTQYLEEADRLADTIAVLDGGRIVARGTASELKALVPGQHVRVDVEDPRALAAVQDLGLEISGIDQKDLAAMVPTTDPLRTVRDVLALADERGIPVTGVSVVKPSLDDVFLALTGSRGSRAAGPSTAPAPTTQHVPATTEAGHR